MGGSGGGQGDGVGRQDDLFPARWTAPFHIRHGPSPIHRAVPLRVVPRSRFDDAFDDLSGRFDDIRYAPVAVNPLIQHETHARRM
jgi:hypothetical protein